MPETLTRERFSELLDHVFKVVLDDSVLELQLVQVDPVESVGAPPDLRRPFSLIFRGPLEPVLPQRLYPIDNERMGALDIFLVPIGRDAQGMRYEAVFS